MLAPRPYALVIAGTASVALALSACGSASNKATTKVPAGSSPSASSPATPGTTTSATTTASSPFVAQWIAVCTKLRAQTAGARTLHEAAALIERYLPQLHAINPPPGKRVDYGQLLATIHSEVAALNHGAGPAAVAPLSARTRMFESKLGLPRCTS